EDGIRDFHVTGVQTCALPICVVDRNAGNQVMRAAQNAVERKQRKPRRKAGQGGGQRPEGGIEVQQRRSGAEAPLIEITQDQRRPDRKSVVEGKRGELGGGGSR